MSIDNQAIDRSTRKKLPAQVGCEGTDGLLRIHSEDDVCDVCGPLEALKPSTPYNFINFLLGEAPDQSGRMVDDYMEFTPERWEQCHDHMQWAFPTRTASAFNPNAPIIPEDFNIFYEVTENQRESIYQNLLALFGGYLDSLGLYYTENHTVRRQDTFTGDWVHAYDHNMRRVTRVIESLRVFGLWGPSHELLNCMVYDIGPQYHRRLTAENVMRWIAAGEEKDWTPTP